MKTILLRKKVAAVAVASLGFGVLTSVAPASAANVALTDVTVGTASQVVVLGTAATSVVNAAHGNLTSAGNDTVKVSISISVPSGSAVTAANANGDGTANDPIITNAGDIAGLGGTAGGLSDGVFTSDQANANVSAATSAIGTATVTPDVAGTYVITVRGLAADGTTAVGTAKTITVVAGDLWGEVSDGVSNGDQTNTAINGVAGAFNTVTLSFQTIVGSRLVTVAGSGGTVSTFTAASGGNATGTISTDRTNIVVTDASTAETTTIRIATPNVGTITVNAFRESAGGIYSTTPYGTVTITVTAAATNGAISSSASTLTLTASGSGVLASNALSVSGPRTSGATIGSIAVALSASVGSVLATNVTTVSITGPGYLTISNANQNSTGRSLTEVGADAAWNIAIIGDGTSGTSTITVTSGTWTATRTVTFFGPASRIVATQNLFNASSAGAQLGNNSAATTAAVSLLVTDSGNTPVSGVTPVAVSSDSSVIASGTCTASTIAGVSLCHVTSAAKAAGSTANVVFKTTVSGVDVNSNAIPFTLAGSLARYSIAFAKPTYAPGEKMTLNITGVTSTGGVVFDGSNDVFDTAITTSSAVTNDWTAALAGITFVRGVGTIDIFAPLASGPFSITTGVASGLQTAVGATTLTASTTVSQNADIAGITTAISALNARVVALNALIAKIMKRLNIR